MGSDPPLPSGKFPHNLFFLLKASLRPNGLALDSENKNNYWCDAKLDRIEKAGIDGSNRQVVTDDKLPHPFGFSLLGDYLYWTDWQDRNIQRADKVDGGGRLIMVSHLDDLVS